MSLTSHECGELGGAKFTDATGTAFACNAESIPGTNATSKSFVGIKKLGSEECKEGGTEVTSASGTTLVCNGTDGTSGESVTSKDFLGGNEPQSPVKEPCETRGGTEFKVGTAAPTFACNGKNGTGGGGPGGLPKTLGEVGTETETGTWRAHLEGTLTEHTTTPTPISFSIPLKKALGGSSVVHYVPNCEEQEGALLTSCEAGRTAAAPDCPGSAEEPKAIEGNLCVYQGYTVNLEVATRELKVASIIKPGVPYIGEEGTGDEQQGASTTGALAVVSFGGGEEPPAQFRPTLSGTWAVTEG